MYFHQIAADNVIKHDCTVKVSRKRGRRNCPNDSGSRLKEQNVSRYVSFARETIITICLSDKFLRNCVLKLEQCIFTYEQTMNETTVKNEIKKKKTTNF